MVLTFQFSSKDVIAFQASKATPSIPPRRQHGATRRGEIASFKQSRAGWNWPETCDAAHIGPTIQKCSKTQKKFAIERSIYFLKLFEFLA